MGVRCNDKLNVCLVRTPCKNGGECTNVGEEGYSCNCPPGWEGKQCTVDVAKEDCDHQPCQNNGTCIEKPGRNNFGCQCALG